MTNREITDYLRIGTRIFQTYRRNMSDTLNLHGSRMMEFAMKHTAES
ncbi:hypothetical protein ACR9YC_04750 [Parasphingorhabdus sp. DH2-15]